MLSLSTKTMNHLLFIVFALFRPAVRVGYHIHCIGFQYHLKHIWIHPSPQQSLTLSLSIVICYYALYNELIEYGSVTFTTIIQQQNCRSSLNKAKGKEVVDSFNHCHILINIHQSILDNVFKGESYRGYALFTFEENKFKNVNISLPIGGCIYGVLTACPMLTFHSKKERVLASKTNSYFWSKDNFNCTLKKIYK